MVIRHLLPRANCDTRISTTPFFSLSLSPSICLLSTRSDNSIVFGCVWAARIAQKPTSLISSRQSSPLFQNSKSVNHRAGPKRREFKVPLYRFGHTLQSTFAQSLAGWAHPNCEKLGRLGKPPHGAAGWQRFSSSGLHTLTESHRQCSYSLSLSLARLTCFVFSSIALGR